MLPVHRRWVLGWLAWGPAGLACGCAAPGGLVGLQRDTVTLMGGLQAVVPRLVAAPQSVLGPADLASLQLDIQEAGIFAGDVAMSLSVAQAAAPVQAMVAAVDLAVQSATKLALAPDVRAVFAAAGALLPALQAPVGLNVAPVGLAAAYSPDEARLVLRAAAQRA